MSLHIRLLTASHSHCVWPFVARVHTMKDPQRYDYVCCDMMYSMLKLEVYVNFLYKVITVLKKGQF
jgi:hypothetical protein